MAYKVWQVMGDAKSDDKFLVLCTVEHMAYGFGVPERIWWQDKLYK